MILGPSWLTFAGAVALSFAIGGGIGFFKGLGHEKNAQAVRVAQQVAEARVQESATARATFRLQEIRDADSIRINDRLADALQRLRNRPADRLPEPARAACQGATGAELSGRDADAFARLAARADHLRSGLAQCQAWIDAVTINQLSK